MDEKRLKQLFHSSACEMREKVSKNDEQFTYKYAKIMQVKIVRDAERRNAKGIGRSKRYGFVEFREHRDALLVLRKLNSQSSAESFLKFGGVTSVHGRLQIEFAVENMKKVNIHLDKVDKH